MRRFKILLGSIVLIFSIFAFMTLDEKVGTPNLSAEKAAANLAPKNLVDNENRIKQYQLRKEQLQNAVATYFERAIQSGEIVGAGVSIVKGDSIVLAQGFGKRSFTGNEEIDGETIFRLGSLSKGFTGVLAADLKNEGKLDWNDKVIDYIPKFQLGDATHTEKVKLKHILSHTSGTPYHSFTNLVEAGLPMSTIAGRFGEVKPISEPGEMYSYQNAMFALSGLVFEKTTGKDINALLKDRFFKPLGMRTAITDYEALDKKKNVALPHVRKRRGYKSLKLNHSYYNAVAAGGIDASALDMAKWMRFLLGHNPEVMSKAEISEAFTPQVEINIGRKYYKRWPGHVKSHYAFGWRVHEFENTTAQKNETIWHHGGSVNRYRNEIALYPNSDLGICVLLNSNSRIARTVIPDLHKIAKTVYEAPQKYPSTPAEAASNTYE